MTSPILAALVTIDDALAGAGVPRMSAFWRGEAERFYEHPTALQLVEMVGRGGDKSRTSVKQAIAEVLAGDFAIPPGETHFYTHVAENVAEASKTLSILEQYLRILKVPHRRAGDTIELAEAPRGFKVLACRVGAVSGWRCIGWTADECAKWEDEGSDPSAEVIASIRAMSITHPTARGRLFSSPLAAAGYFFEAWDAGDTEHQVIGHAPSWIANESITEARTRELEPHEPTRMREYGAVAGSGSADAIATDDAAAMVRALSPHAVAHGMEIGVLDSSSGRGDGWAYAFARYAVDQGRVVLHVAELGAFEGRFGADVSFDAVVGHIAEIARRRGVARVLGDQYQAFALSSAFARYGVAYVEKPWSQPTKVEALATLRRLLRERTLVVEPGVEGEALRRELLTLREVLLPSKVFTVQARRTGRGHADRASVVLMLARAIAEGDVHAAGVAGPGGGAPPHARPQMIPTRFGSGLGGGFQDWGGSRWRPPPAGDLPGKCTDPAPKLDGPRQIAVPTSPGQAPRVVSVPQPSMPAAPRFGGGWGRGGSNKIW